MTNKLGQEPAFPMANSEVNFDQNGVIADQANGMSKRFYAACAAMKGILSGIYSSRDAWSDIKNKAKNDKITFDQLIIKQSFEFADELLKQENE